MCNLMNSSYVYIYGGFSRDCPLTGYTYTDCYGVRKKMDCSGKFQAPKKKRPIVGSRYQLEINFPDKEARQDFMSRLDKAKRWLSRS